MVTRSMARNMALIITASDRASNSNCPICLEALIPGEGDSPVIQLKCGHRGHSNCLSYWIAENYICPTCRSRVTSSGINTADGKTHYFIQSNKRRNSRSKRRSVAIQNSPPTRQDLNSLFQVPDTQFFSPVEPTSSTSLVQDVTSSGIPSGQPFLLSEPTYLRHTRFVFLVLLLMMISTEVFSRSLFFM